MNPDPLDDLLSAYSQQATPLPSGRLTGEVWRQIEARRAHLPWLLSFHWGNLLQKPRLALAAAAVALLAGILPAANSTFADLQAQRVRDSLHFEVFSADSASVLVAAVRPIRK